MGDVRDINRNWRPDLSGIRNSRRHAATALYGVAEAQRRYAMLRLDRWPMPEPAEPIPLHLSTLACETYAPLVMRMVSSFLERAGEPASMTVVSDGSLSNDSLRALRRIWPAIEIVTAGELLEAEWLPDQIRRAAKASPYMVKVAWLTRPEPDELPSLYLDCDIEMMRGAPRLRELLAEFDTPRYQFHPPLGNEAPEAPYDLRISDGQRIVEKVNSGVILRRGPLDFERALRLLEPYADAPEHLTEQTTIAIALTDSGAEPLDPAEYVLDAGDLNRPWDSFSRSDVVLRHYCTDGLKAKMFTRSTPTGLRSLPSALASYALRRAA